LHTMSQIKNYQHINFVPSQTIAKYAEEGLRLRAQFHRGGTEVGLARAEELMSRMALSPETILRMYSFFARHEVDKRGKNFGNPLRPSNGFIAWMLWGGDPAQQWVTSVRLQMKEADMRG
jgi:hypothetical protein